MILLSYNLRLAAAYVFLLHIPRQGGAQSVSKLDRRKLLQLILLVLACTPPLRFGRGLMHSFAQEF